MNWGIIGYGEIAPSFIESLQTTPETLYGIASISKSKFLTEENRYPTAKIFNSYFDLLSDKNIDIVYICTTNQLHKQNVLDALRAGKHVLCEKPLGISENEVILMVKEAKKQNKFLMEGMWTKFLPAYKFFKSKLTEEIIGELQFLRVDFGFLSPWASERRLLNKELFGGTILDNGDYNIFLSLDVFNDLPKKISVVSHLSETRVEDMCSVVFQYKNGAIAQLFSSFVINTTHEALICGTKGYIKLLDFWHGTKVIISINDKEETFTIPFKSTGFVHEINEVVDCIKNKQIESDIIPHKLSLNIAKIIDKILKQIKK